jgi:hypothetical protein
MADIACQMKSLPGPKRMAGDRITFVGTSSGFGTSCLRHTCLGAAERMEALSDTGGRTNGLAFSPCTG